MEGLRASEQESRRSLAEHQCDQAGHFPHDYPLPEPESEHHRAVYSRATPGQRRRRTKRHIIPNAEHAALFRDSDYQADKRAHTRTRSSRLCV